MLSHIFKKRELFSLIFVLSLFLYSSPHLKAEIREIQKEDVKLSYHIRSFKPGEAFLIELKGKRAIKTIDGILFDKAIPFYTNGDSPTYHAVGGIDIHTKPGDYDLILTVHYRDGETLILEDTLKVAGKTFETRKIKVDEGYVNLNKGNKKRADNERKRLKGIFNTVDAERIWNGDFTMPIPGAETTSEFGNRRIINGKPGAPHKGIDLRAGEGAEIYASNKSRVALAEELYFTGKTVILDHGMGIYTIYGHLSDIEVKDGAMIEKGDIIGRAGSTGRVTGPHLHFGAKVMGSAVDPISLIELVLR